MRLILPLPVYTSLPLPRPPQRPAPAPRGLTFLTVEDPVEYRTLPTPDAAVPRGPATPRRRVVLPREWQPLLRAARRAPDRLAGDAGLRPGWERTLTAALDEWARTAVAAHARAGLWPDHCAHIAARGVCPEPLPRDHGSAHQRMAQALLDARVAPLLATIAETVRGMAGPFWAEGSVRLRLHDQADNGLWAPATLPLLPASWERAPQRDDAQPAAPVAVVEAHLRHAGSATDPVAIRCAPDRFPQALRTAVDALRRTDAALRGGLPTLTPRPAWFERSDPLAADRRRLARDQAERLFEAQGDVRFATRYGALWRNGRRREVWSRHPWPIVPDLRPYKPLNLVVGCTGTGKSTLLASMLTRMRSAPPGGAQVVPTAPWSPAIRQQAFSRAMRVLACDNAREAEPSPPRLPLAPRPAPRGGPWPPAPHHGSRAALRAAGRARCAA